MYLSLFIGLLFPAFFLADEPKLEDLSRRLGSTVPASLFCEISTLNGNSVLRLAYVLDRARTDGPDKQVVFRKTSNEQEREVAEGLSSHETYRIWDMSDSKLLVSARDLSVNGRERILILDELATKHEFEVEDGSVIVGLKLVPSEVASASVLLSTSKADSSDIQINLMTFGFDGKPSVRLIANHREGRLVFVKGARSKSSYMVAQSLADGNTRLTILGANDDEKLDIHDFTVLRSIDDIQNGCEILMGYRKCEQGLLCLLRLDDSGRVSFDCYGVRDIESCEFIVGGAVVDNDSVVCAFAEANGRFVFRNLIPKVFFREEYLKYFHQPIHLRYGIRFVSVDGILSFCRLREGYGVDPF